MGGGGNTDGRTFFVKNCTSLCKNQPTEEGVVVEGKGEVVVAFWSSVMHCQSCRTVNSPTRENYARAAAIVRGGKKNTLSSREK